MRFITTLILFVLIKSAHANIIVEFDVTYNTRSTKAGVDTSFTPVSFTQEVTFITDTLQTNFTSDSTSVIAAANIELITGYSPFTNNLLNELMHVSSPNVEIPKLSVQRIDRLTFDPVSLFDDQIAEMTLMSERSTVSLGGFTESAIYNFSFIDADNFSQPFPESLNLQPINLDLLLADYLIIGKEWEVFEGISELGIQIAPVIIANFKEINYEGTAIISSVTIVPVPPALLLFGSALIFLYISAKKKLTTLPLV